MTNFNTALTCGDFAQGRLTAVIDVPMGSCLKIEWDWDACVFHLGRVEPMIFAKPVNYGFIVIVPGDDRDAGDRWQTLDDLGGRRQQRRAAQ
ncbi:hypothetical protein IV500_11840 [Paeniglutamicibacter antarcticus]|uniref:Uncharacterized protein n=1 Tax=Arthrobacter terrae TaxID=2935737 RepID=A0A931CRE7_9MICC|nr:hypothetical protein [Arthrobacter terrae]MBG0740074.1 hypothetical protein [Arthrobacter terrae]